MSDSMKAELEKLMRQTATQRGLEPVVVNADGLDLEDVAKAVTDLVKAGRTAWPHLVSLWLAVVGLAGALGWTWLSPDNVAPQQIAATVAAYEIASDSPAPPSNPATSEPTAVAGPRLPASLEIEGPSSATPGDLIVLEARGDSEAVRWFLGNSSKTFLPVDGGKRVVFASGTPGEYRFFAVGATVDAGKISLDDDTHTVVIGTPGPAPVPPNPTPTPTPVPVPPEPTPTPPNPSPVIPDDAFGNVGRLTFDTVAKFGQSARSKAPATGSLYCEAAARLAGDGDPARLFVNVSAAMAWLKQERTATWGTDAAEWQKFVDTIAVPWNERWPMDKATAAEFLDAVGKALKAVKS
jgi:hypothetical protein